MWPGWAAPWPAWYDCWDTAKTLAGPAWMWSDPNAEEPR